MILKAIPILLAAAVLSGPARADDAQAPAAPAAAAPAAPKKEPAKPKKKAEGKAKKKGAQKEDKYKSRALAESEEHSYRFDASGNPVGKKKSSAAKAKKKPVSEDAPEKPACSEDESCPGGRSPDADAL